MSNLISSKEACERAINPAAMKLLVPNTPIAKSKFLEAGPNSPAILNNLIQFGVLEDVSPTEVRLKPNVPLDENFIRKVSKDDFDKIWAIFQ